MNETQTIFTLFFAISWGIVSNVLHRWKPFHFAMWWHPYLWHPTRRIIAGFIVLNFVPWVMFVFVMVWLRGRQFCAEDWNVWNGMALILRAILPGLVPFGCYRLWVALVQYFPRCFYASNQNEVPFPFRGNGSESPIEPTVRSLHLCPDGAINNLVFGLIYVAFALCALIPGPK